MILHLSQIFLTEALTFMELPRRAIIFSFLFHPYPWFVLDSSLTQPRLFFIRGPALGASPSFSL